MSADDQVKNFNGTVFLFSLPRSGSTWIGKILDSHPNILYRHEPDSVRAIPDMPLFPAKNGSERLIDGFRTYHDGISRMRDAKVCGKAPFFPKDYMSTSSLYWYRATAAFTKVALRLGFEMPIIGASVGLPSSRLVWKSIESLGRLGLALTALPDSQGVFLIRHPCGYVASVLRGQGLSKFDDKSDPSSDYRVFEMLLATEFARESNLTIDALRAMTPEERLAWRWVLANTVAFHDTTSIRSRCYVLSYDQMCSDPLKTSAGLFDWLGLSWSRESENFVLRSIGQHKESYYSVVKNPEVSANRWRKELDTKAIDSISKIANRSEVGSLFSY